MLSRDDLIEQCWDGVVGDNAINQVISRLRHVFADLGAARAAGDDHQGRFRLVVDGQAAGAEPPVKPYTGEERSAIDSTSGADSPLWHRGWTRRAMALGLAGAGGAGAWWAYWGQSSAVGNPLVGARFTRLTDFPGSENDAAISRDGRFVAFRSDATDRDTCQPDRSGRFSI